GLVGARFSRAHRAEHGVLVTRSRGGRVVSRRAGIRCGSTCSARAHTGARARLSAIADSGWTFAGWRGACSGKSVICTVRVGRAKLVALFRRVYRLTWTVVGNGEVSASHAGTPGGARVLQGTTTSTLSSADSLTLTASAPSGTRFEGFSGSCTGRAHSCTLAADAPKSVTATFSPGSDGTITYGINVTRSGAGLVTSDPAGSGCGPNTRSSSAWPANPRHTLTHPAGPHTQAT